MTVINQNENILMNLNRQSTIYRRHEKRMIASYQQRNDTRMVHIRVLARLPGLRSLMKPFDSKKYKTCTEAKSKNDLVPQQGQLEASNPVTFAFEDQNVFSPYDNHTKMNAENMEQLDSSSRHLHISLFAGFVGGTMESIFGRSYTKKLSQASGYTPSVTGNTFSRFSIQPRANELSIHSTFLDPSNQTFQELQQQRKALISNGILVHSLARGLLFTTNAYFRLFLDHMYFFKVS